VYELGISAPAAEVNGAKSGSLICDLGGSTHGIFRLELVVGLFD
jgi:hypothetical protein